MWGVSLTQPTLTLLLCGEFFLHSPRCLCFYVGSFSYTSRDVLIFMEGVSLTHRVLASFLSSGEFILHIPCWFKLKMGSVSYTSRAGFLFLRRVSLTHPKLVSFISYTSRADLIFIWWVSVTHLVLPSFLCEEFLLHIPCCLKFYPRFDGVVFIYFILGVSLTHPVLVAFFFIGGFSYTSRAG